MMNVPLIIATLVWVFLVWNSILPILSMPVAKIKREFALTLLVIGSIGLIIECLTKLEMHPVTIISLSAFVVITGILVYLLHRLDYYVEEVLQELFVLAMSSAGIGIITSLWYWGIANLMSLMFLRVVVATLPLVVYLISWLIARQKFSMWSAVIYTVLLLVKWITFPMWGIWSVILLMLYSTLVGYVANWMATTTYAEKIIAWNVEPAKVWSLLVLSAGMLVLFF